MDFEEMYQAYRDGTINPGAVAMAEQHIAAAKDRTRELMGIYLTAALSQGDIPALSQATREIRDKIEEIMSDPVVGPAVMLNMAGMLVSVGMTMMLNGLTNADGEDV